MAIRLTGGTLRQLTSWGNVRCPHQETSATILILRACAVSSAAAVRQRRRGRRTRGLLVRGERTPGRALHTARGARTAAQSPPEGATSRRRADNARESRELQRNAPPLHFQDDESYRPAKGMLLGAGKRGNNRRSAQRKLNRTKEYEHYTGNRRLPPKYERAGVFFFFFFLREQFASRCARCCYSALQSGRRN